MQTQSRLERLDRLESWLKSDEMLVLRDAAMELSVSIRTINRDIELLRERGIPVEADRGRGGGVRLNSQWGVGRVSFTYREAIDLLVGIAMNEQTDQPMQMGQSTSIKRKLMASFSHQDQAKINKLRNRIRTGGRSTQKPVDSFTSSKPQVGTVLKEAFLLNKVAELTYKDGGGKETKRLIESHFLVLNPPIWYAVCWDQLRSDIRTFRCDRMRDLVLTEKNFHLRPWQEFMHVMDGNPTISI